MKHFWNRVPWPAKAVLSAVPALVLYYLTVMRHTDLEATRFLQFHPNPDATEYATLADSLLEKGTLRIYINQEPFPSRYPIGYSLLTALYSKVTGTPPLFAVFRLNHALGAVLILCTAGFLQRTTSSWGALIGAACLSSNPGFISFCRAPLSEITLVMFTLLLFGCLYAYTRTPALWKIGVCGLIAGLSTLARTQGVFLSLSIAGIVIWQLMQDRDLKRFVLRACTSFSGFLLGLMPMGLYNYLTFGSPLKDGYDYWIPFLGPTVVFRAESVPDNLDTVLSTFLLRQQAFEVSNLFGPGPYFSPGGAALLGLTLLLLVWNKPTRPLTLVMLLSVLPIFTYRYPSIRYVLPHLLLLMSASGWAVHHAVVQARHAPSPTAAIRNGALCVLLAISAAASITGFFSAKGALAHRRRDLWQIRTLVNGDFVRGKSLPYTLARTFQENCPVPLSDVMIVSEVNPVLVDLWIDGPVHTLPAQQNHSYQHGQPHNISIPTIERALRKAVTEQKRVYYFPRSSPPEEHPALQPYAWSPVENMQAGPLSMYELIPPEQGRE